MAEESGGAPAKGGGSLLWIAIAAGASLASATGTFFVVSRSATTPAGPAKAEAHAPAEGEGEHAADAAAAEHAAPAQPTAPPQRAAPPEHAPPPSAASGYGGTATSTFELETFVVNINDGERDRFLKLKPELELSDPAVGAELKARMPQVKDVVISLLSSQSFNQIRSIEGKDALREELMLRLNALVRSGKVSRVYFTEFVVQ